MKNKCEWCGRTYTVHILEFGWKERYCSKKCKYEAEKANKI